MIGTLGGTLGDPNCPQAAPLLTCQARGEGIALLGERIPGAHCLPPGECRLGRGQGSGQGNLKWEQPSRVMGAWGWSTWVPDHPWQESDPHNVEQHSLHSSMPCTPVSTACFAYLWVTTKRLTGLTGRSISTYFDDGKSVYTRGSFEGEPVLLRNGELAAVSPIRSTS